MYKTKEFKKDLLLDLIDGVTMVDTNDCCINQISNKIISHERWSIIYELIFEFITKENEVKYYKVNYSVGATECQDETPFQYDKDLIMCYEVKPAKKVITVYEGILVDKK